ncbi:MAG: hypothetical protein NTY14_06165 [Candidatus Omnitrophica bacterium]|nr:hypothetical protein [Candidatus Omnitrophota bacterium]
MIGRLHERIFKRPIGALGKNVRDGDGKYLGCLELTQDITEIQKLSGEKRLLNEV